MRVDEPSLLVQVQLGCFLFSKNVREVFRRVFEIVETVGGHSVKDFSLKLKH